MEDIKNSNRMISRRLIVLHHYLGKLDADLCELSGVLAHWLKKGDIDKKEALEYAIRQIDNFIMLQSEISLLAADIENFHENNIAPTPVGPFTELAPHKGCSYGQPDGPDDFIKDCECDNER